MKFILALCILAAVPLLEAAKYRRTVVAIEKPTSYGDYIFLRGGDIDGKSIPIKHTVSPKDKRSFFAQTSSGDNYLNWNGGEGKQGSYWRNWSSVKPMGTPMIWTTNDNKSAQTLEKNAEGYWKLNTGGPNYWIADFEMDCSKVNGGWFGFKGYMVKINGYNPGWEPSSLYQRSCDVNGTNVFIPKAKNYNHYGICGHFNVVNWGTNFCMSKEMSEVEANAEFISG